MGKAVNRLREVLDDSADQPRLIETLPRQGYRFIAPVERVEPKSRSASGNLAGKKISHYRVLEILGGRGDCFSSKENFPKTLRSVRVADSLHPVFASPRFSIQSRCQSTYRPRMQTHRHPYTGFCPFREGEPHTM